ncbi:Hsp20/alpha crystallin family protein [Lentisphaerota bacterium WC36G]|nr:Hsp20/alpha crystallin family protein [Lentisphaerae bacterium WC36]
MIRKIFTLKASALKISFFALFLMLSVALVAQATSGGGECKMMDNKEAQCSSSMKGKCTKCNMKMDECKCKCTKCDKMMKDCKCKCTKCHKMMKECKCCSMKGDKCCGKCDKDMKMCKCKCTKCHKMMKECKCSKEMMKKGKCCGTCKGDKAKCKMKDMVKVPMMMGPMMKMNKENIMVCYKVPGYTEDEITIKVEDQMLMVKGEKMMAAGVEEDDKDGDEVEVEKYCMFSSTIMLPEKVDAKKMTKKMKDGKLMITLPKMMMKKK